MEHFTEENYSGATQAELDLMNAALAVLMDGVDECDSLYASTLQNAADRVSNNWQPTGNTVETLVR